MQTHLLPKLVLVARESVPVTVLVAEHAPFVATMVKQLCVQQDVSLNVIVEEDKNFFF